MKRSLNEEFSSYARMDRFHIAYPVSQMTISDGVKAIQDKYGLTTLIVTMLYHSYVYTSDPFDLPGMRWNFKRTRSCIFELRGVTMDNVPLHLHTSANHGIPFDELELWVTGAHLHLPSEKAN